MKVTADTNRECMHCGKQNCDGSWFNEYLFECNDCEAEQNGETGPTDSELIHLFGSDNWKGN